jgi:phosphoribosyl-AMP cyclohydrolase/adenine/guanine phosphoribosyltransferase-like PRPP-binding protein
MKVSLARIDFGKGGGLVPVVARDNATGKVLMMAYADRNAVQHTLDTGFAHYFSRSRGRLWKKGVESGHVQRVRAVRVDCDRDALLYEVDQTGPACHTGEETCFFSELQAAHSNEYDRAMAGEVVKLLEGAALSRRRWVKDSSRSEYRYLVNPVTEGIPPAPPEVLEWLVEMLDRVASGDVDKVVTFESLGIPYATLLAQRRKKPLAIIRKRDFGHPESLTARVPYASGFERGTYFVYGVGRGEKVLLIDDMVSTGGSLIPTIKVLRRKGVKVEDALCVCEKPQYGGSDAVRRRTGVRVKTLFRMGEIEGRIAASPTLLLSRLLSSGRAKQSPSKARK